MNYIFVISLRTAEHNLGGKEVVRRRMGRKEGER
jgi:hypothetical protein